MHLRTYRHVVRVLLDQGLVHPPVSCQDALTKLRIKKFLQHMETAVTSRKRRYHPDTVNNASRSLSVLAKVMLGKHPDLERNVARQRADRLITYVRRAAKSVREALAIEGLYLEQQAANLKAPLTLEDRVENEPCCSGVLLEPCCQEMLANRHAFRAKVQREAAKVKEEEGRDPLPLARMEAGLLGTDFIIRTANRS